MKPRARRVTIGAAVLGVVLVAAMVVANWGTVRDHVEAWHFQLTQDTRMLEPTPLNEGDVVSGLQILARCSNRSVAFDSSAVFWNTNYDVAFTTDMLLSAFREHGCRILEQRFPRRAYVIIGDPSRYWQRFTYSERP